MTDPLWLSERFVWYHVRHSPTKVQADAKRPVPTDKGSATHAIRVFQHYQRFNTLTLPFTAG